MNGRTVALTLKLTALTLTTVCGSLARAQTQPEIPCPGVSGVMAQTAPPTSRGGIVASALASTVSDDPCSNLRPLAPQPPPPPPMPRLLLPRQSLDEPTGYNTGNRWLPSWTLGALVADAAAYRNEHKLPPEYDVRRPQIDRAIAAMRVQMQHPDLPENAREFMRAEIQKLEREIVDMEAPARRPTRPITADLTEAQLREGLALANAACPELPPVWLREDRMGFTYVAPAHAARDERRAQDVTSQLILRSPGPLQGTRLVIGDDAVVVHIDLRPGFGQLHFDFATGALIRAELRFPYRVREENLVYDAAWRQRTWQCLAASDVSQGSLRH